MRDAPPPHPLAVEVQPVDEIVQATLHRTLRRRPSVADQRGDVELALADQWLRVDREPASLGEQEVAAVEILMEEHRLALGRAGLTQEGHCLVDERPFERAAEALPVVGKELGPVRRLILQTGEGVAGRDPELLEDAGGDGRRLLVRELPRLRPGSEALEQECPTLAVVRVYACGAHSVPTLERLTFELGLGLLQVDLQDGLVTVGKRRLDDVGVLGVEGLAEAQRPELGALVRDWAELFDQVFAPTTSAASCATSVGVVPTFTPQASSASFFACAVPEVPEMIAPAWPIVLPGGAVKPAM